MIDLVKATTPTLRILLVSALTISAMIVLSLRMERKAMDLTESNAITEAATPTIDASAPIETATFALG